MLVILNCFSAGMKYIRNLGRYKAKGRGSLHLGVDWRVENVIFKTWMWSRGEWKKRLQLGCAICSGAGEKSQREMCAGTGRDEPRQYPLSTNLCECKRNSDHSRRKHNEVTNRDQGTLPVSHLSLNSPGIGKYSSLFFSSSWERWIVAWQFSCY